MLLELGIHWDPDKAQSLSALIRRWSWQRASPFLWQASELRPRFGRMTFNKRDDV